LSFNLAAMLRESALAAPDEALVHVGDHSLTYAEMRRKSCRLNRTATPPTLICARKTGLVASVNSRRVLGKGETPAI
jgi:hypothetical protein